MLLRTLLLLLLLLRTLLLLLLLLLLLSLLLLLLLLLLLPPFCSHAAKTASTLSPVRYTDGEKKVLSSYESLDYLPPDSKAYRDWLRDRQAGSRGGELDRWVVMGLIGLAVGLLGFLLHQLIDLVARTKWQLARELARDSNIFLLWCWIFGYSLAFLLPSALLERIRS